MRVAGELAVVGVMLEDECPSASSGRYRQQWCSALQQAMDLMPEDTGKESGAPRSQARLCACSSLQHYSITAQLVALPPCSAAFLCTWQQQQLPDSTCCNVANGYERRPQTPCRAAQPAPGHLHIAAARRPPAPRPQEPPQQSPPPPPPLVPARQLRRLPDHTALHRGPLLVRNPRSFLVTLCSVKLDHGCSDRTPHLVTNALPKIRSTAGKHRLPSADRGRLTVYWS